MKNEILIINILFSGTCKIFAYSKGLLRKRQCLVKDVLNIYVFCNHIFNMKKLFINKLHAK